MTTQRRAAGDGLLSALAQAQVSEAMHAGLFTCSADTPLSSVAQVMSEQRIHAVVVSGVPTQPASDDHAWGIVSDLDLLRAALAGGREATAGQVAVMEFLTVESGESLERAAQLMAEHEVTHLVVLDPETGHAVGVLSTHDVAGAIASADD
jgi:CBS domain-containing protein